MRGEERSDGRARLLLSSSLALLCSALPCERERVRSCSALAQSFHFVLFCSFEACSALSRSTPLCSSQLRLTTRLHNRIAETEAALANLGFGSAKESPALVEPTKKAETAKEEAAATTQEQTPVDAADALAALGFGGNDVDEGDDEDEDEDAGEAEEGGAWTSGGGYSLSF